MIKKGILRRDLTSTSNSNSSGVVVIGDIHGCADQLKEIIEQIKELPYSPTILFTGDLLDRGEGGREVWNLVRGMCASPSEFNAKDVVVLKGNHEQMFLDAYNSYDTRSYEYRLWEMNGGMEEDMDYIAKLGAKEIEWMKSLEPYYIHPNKVNFRQTTKNLIVTHAAVRPRTLGGDVKNQDPAYLFWERKIEGYGKKWLTIHGHTIQPKGNPTLYSTPTGEVMMVDTGSFLTGIVTGVELVDVE